ncbi:MAG: toprim domain-containing protein [Candidatus Kapaibacterium sp.]
MQQTYADFGIDVSEGGSGEVRAKCPQCPTARPYKHRSSEQTSRDLAVNLDEGIWFCHRCGWAGSLKEKSGSEEYYPFWSPIKTDIKGKTIAEQKTENAYSWFKKRGISKEVIDRNKIIYTKTYFPQHKKELPAIGFCYHVGDNLVNIKYRSPNKDFRQEKDSVRTFYKLNDIAISKTAIITEGEIDALSFEQAGFRNAVSVPDGGLNGNVKNAGKKFDFLDNCVEYFEHIEKIYLALDTDAPGIRMREELARRLGKPRCWIVEYPPGCKDANDLLQKHGADKLREAVENAEPYPVSGIYTADDRYDELIDLYENGFPEGPWTGKWRRFDELVTYHDSNLVLITGIPSSGKTTFLDNWMILQGIMYDYKTAMFSPENKRWETHMLKLSRIITGKPWEDAHPNRMSREELDAAHRFIKGHIFYIKPEKSDFTLEEIYERAHYLVVKHGIKNLVIDSWMKLAHLQRPHESDDKYHARILNTMTDTAIRLGINIYLVAHTTKLKRIPGSLKNYIPPGLYDVSGSAHFYNQADIGIVVHRTHEEHLDDGTHVRDGTKIYVKKVREDFMGRLGEVDMEYYLGRLAERGRTYGENLLNEYVEIGDEGYPASWDEI